MSSKIDKAKKRVVKKETKPKVKREVKVKKETKPKVKRVVVKKETKLKREVKPKAVRKGKYDKEGIPPELFCGSSGGSRPNSFPVNTPGRAIAALSYARKAPNPQGIRDCARSVALSKGWVNPKTGRIQRVRK